MQLNNRFHEVFGSVPVLGMIHLAGNEPVRRALEEIDIFAEEGVDGAIIENYHGQTKDVIHTLAALSRRTPGIIVGVNILPNEFEVSLPLATRYAARFIQLDHVAGKYDKGEVSPERYVHAREASPDIIVLGGVWPKYYHPVEGSDLETDIRTAMQRAEAVVVTGRGTGIETDIDKIRKFREILGEHPLIIGAGLKPENAYEQLMLADGCIVGSCFKSNQDTTKPVDAYLVRDFMTVIKQVRKDK